MQKDFTKIYIENVPVGQYSEYYVINHLTKKKEPSRTDSFAMSNINDIAQIEIPEIIINFKYLPIELYREIFMLTRKAEFKVEYYDQDYDTMRTNMFYVKEQSSLKPHAFNKKYLGMKDYTLDLVCTMNPISTLEVHLSDLDDNVIQRPFIIDIVKGQNYSLKIYLTEIRQLAQISGNVTISFSNSEQLGINNKIGSSYELNVSSNGTTFIINTNKVKQKGEYVMFISSKATQENYGNTTISCILRVV